MRPVAESSRRRLLGVVEAEIALAAAAPELAPALRRRMAAAIPGAGPMAERLRPCDASSLDARGLHAIAAVALARLRAAPDDAAPEELETAARASIHTWAALAERESYVRALATRVVGRDEARAGELAARIGLEAVGARLDDAARAGRDVGAWLRALGAGPATAGALSAETARMRMTAIDLVLEPVRRVLDELATRRPSVDELVRAFASARTAWQRLDRDVEVEALVVERLPDFAWDLYRQRAHADLARILAEVAEPSTSLAARIERGEPAIAWAAPCAQALVFRAELAPRFDAQVELAERALRICPSLRNARIVLGDFLLTRAERALDRRVDRTSAGTTPEEDVTRAEGLHPELKRLAIVRAKLRRVGAPP